MAVGRFLVVEVKIIHCQWSDNDDDDDDERIYFNVE